MFKIIQKRTLSLILVLLMVLSSISFASVFAAEQTQAEVGEEVAASTAYSLPYQKVDGLYAYAGTQVSGTNAWQRWDNVNNTRYFYLAPTVSDTQVIILNTYSTDVILNGVTIPAGEYATVPYTDGTTYTCSGATTQSVKIMKTDAEGTIFLNAQESTTYKDDNGNMGNLADLNKDLYSFMISGTKNQETGSVAGAVASEASGVLEDTTIKKFKGRGNTTWDLDKKPFNITYEDNIELDGMMGKKWSLLANAQDSSLIRNRLIYDLSQEVGMMYACDSRFVDMFVNGDYKGSYQLTQKIEMGKNTVMSDLEEPIVEVEEEGDVVPTENFDFILEIDMAEKAASAGDLTFLSGRGQVMTHKVPDEPTSEQVAFMKQKYQAFEDALYSNDMATLEKLIDINDLAKAYLINEISKNLDGALTSCYFVYNSAKDIFYASPVWDFDNGVGNTVGLSDRKDINGNVLYNTKPDGWYTREMIHIESSYDPKGDGRTIFSEAWYMTAKTSDNKTFAELVKEIWNEEFSDLVQILNGETVGDGRLQSVDSYLSKLAKSGEWNYSNAGWDLNNSTNNSWIANHSALTYYTYNAENNTLSKENRTYNQQTFSGQAAYAADWLVSRIAWMSSEYAEAELDAEGGYVTVYFAKDSTWSDAYIYGFYGEEGGTPEAEWPSAYPGKAMDFVEVDKNGKKVYSCKVPADIDYIKFSDGSSSNLRTNNVPNSMLTEGASFCLGSSAGTNKWDVVTYDFTPSGDDGTGDDTFVTESNFTLRGTFTSWSFEDPLMYMDGSDTVTEAVYTLEAGEYKFKFYDMSAAKWYGNDGIIADTTTATSSVGWEMKTGAGNCTLTATGGTYTFRFNTVTHILEVLYETEKAETFTVTFVDHDGTVLSSQVVEKGKSAVSPETPAREATAQYTYTFKEWDKDFSDITADTVVTAVYTETLNKYTVTFKDYDGAELSVQTIEYGASATAPATPQREGYTFKEWDVDFSNIVADTVVTAKYSKIVVPATTGRLSVDVAGGTGFKISVDGGTARPQGATYLNSKIKIGSTVTITANDTVGATFIGWTNPNNGQIYSADLTYTFIASGNDTFRAVYATDIDGVQMVTFKNDKAGSNGRILDMQYYASEDAIVFPDDPTQVGFDFAGWSMTEAEIQTAIAKGEDVTVLATWTRQLVYVNVTVSGGTGGGKVLANSAVTVTANTAPAGQKFAYWTDADGNIKSYSEDYKFYPAADTTVIAVFVAEGAEIEQQVLISLDYIDYAAQAAANKAVFGYSWYLPSEYTIVKAGLVAVNKDNYNEETLVAGSSDSNVYDRSSTSKLPTGSATWSKSSVFEGQTWIAKAYIQYTDASGEIHTVYSDLFEATKE